MGVFDWQLAVIGRNSPSVECPYGPPAATATRYCGGNFLTGGLWESPDVSRCRYKSERTNKLDSLAKVRHTFRKSVYFVLKLFGHKTSNKELSDCFFLHDPWNLPLHSHSLE